MDRILRCKAVGGVEMRRKRITSKTSDGNTFMKKPTDSKKIIRLIDRTSCEICQRNLQLETTNYLNRKVIDTIDRWFAYGQLEGMKIMKNDIEDLKNKINKRFKGI